MENKKYVIIVKGYTGFDKLKGQLSKRSGVTDPAAIAAYIGRKKYGKKKFQNAAAKGKSMRENLVKKDIMSRFPGSPTEPQSGYRPAYLTMGLKKAIDEMDANAQHQTLNEIRKNVGLPAPTTTTEKPMMHIDLCDGGKWGLYKCFGGKLESSHGSLKEAKSAARATGREFYYKSPKSDHFVYHLR